MSARELAARWLRFNIVGLVGIGVQLAALALYARVFGWHYLVATALAVETAVLHNFAWHERWTWADRARVSGGAWRRLLAFNLSNGLVSLIGTTIVLTALAGGLGVPPLWANAVAIVACSFLNFILADRLVFARHESARAVARVPPW